MEGRCEYGFLDQPLDCVSQFKTLPMLRYTCLSSFKFIGGVFVTVCRIDYGIGADLNTVI